MALDFDNFPVYDDLIKQNTDKLSDVWCSFLATFVQTLQGYLSQNGMYLPPMTQDQRDNNIPNPVGGQMIYNTTIKKGQIYEEANPPGAGWKNLF